MWAYHARQDRTWRWSSPASFLACWKHSSILPRVPAIQAKSSRVERRGPVADVVGDLARSRERVAGEQPVPAPASPSPAAASSRLGPVRDTGPPASLPIGDPRLGQIQRPVDQRRPPRRGTGQECADLAVLDPASGPGVPPLHPRRPDAFLQDPVSSTIGTPPGSPRRTTT